MDKDIKICHVTMKQDVTGQKIVVPIPYKIGEDVQARIKRYEALMLERGFRVDNNDIENWIGEMYGNGLTYEDLKTLCPDSRFV